MARCLGKYWRKSSYRPARLRHEVTAFGLSGVYERRDRAKKTVTVLQVNQAGWHIEASSLTFHLPAGAARPATAPKLDAPLLLVSGNVDRRKNKKNAVGLTGTMQTKSLGLTSASTNLVSKPVDVSIVILRRGNKVRLRLRIGKRKMDFVRKGKTVMLPFDALFKRTPVDLWWRTFPGFLTRPLADKFIAKVRKKLLYLANQTNPLKPPKPKILPEVHNEADAFSKEIRRKYSAAEWVLTRSYIRAQLSTINHKVKRGLLARFFKKTAPKTVNFKDLFDKVLIEVGQTSNYRVAGDWGIPAPNPNAINYRWRINIDDVEDYDLFVKGLEKLLKLLKKLRKLPFMRALPVTWLLLLVPIKVKGKIYIQRLGSGGWAKPMEYSYTLKVWQETAVNDMLKEKAKTDWSVMRTEDNKVWTPQDFEGSFSIGLTCVNRQCSGGITFQGDGARRPLSGLMNLQGLNVYAGTILVSQGTTTLKSAVAKKKKTVKRRKVRNVHFRWGCYSLTRDGERALRRFVARNLVEIGTGVPSAKRKPVLGIEAHASEDGKANYNMKLSSFRGQEVQRYMSHLLASNEITRKKGSRWSFLRRRRFYRTYLKTVMSRKSTLRAFGETVSAGKPGSGTRLWRRVDIKLNGLNAQRLTGE